MRNMPTKEGKANHHPFWSVTQSAWVETKDLKEGEILSLEDGSEVAIESILHYGTEETTVYNFEVEDNHTYYVSDAGVLVHNQGSEYNGVITDPMQILYSMFAPVKKEQVSAALKNVGEPKSAMEYAACNGPTGAVCTGAKVTGHLIDGEYSEASAFALDRAGENVLGFATGYGIGSVFKIGKTFSVVPKNLQKNATKTSSKTLKQAYSELVEEATQKYGGNVTVQRNGIDLFRVHQTSSGHGFKVTQFKNNVTPNGIFKNPIDVNVRKTHLNQLQRGLNEVPPYKLRKRGEK
jgi:hypothetical protein